MLVKESQPNKKVLILSSYRYNLPQTNELIQLFFDSKLEVLLPQEMKRIDYETIETMQRFVKQAFKYADYIYVNNLNNEIELGHLDIIHKAIAKGKSVYFSCKPSEDILKDATQEFYDQTMIVAPEPFASLVIFEDDVWRQRQFFSECALIQKEA